MLSAVSDLCPVLYPFIHSSYSAPSHLFWGSRRLVSAEGVQQGDPLGPLLFCLTIHPLIIQLKSEFKLFYLDDGTIGGDPESLHSDLSLISEGGVELGLRLNSSKSEIVGTDPSVSFLSLPDARFVYPRDAILLGSSVGDVSSISSVLEQKTSLLKSLGDRLHLLSAHDSLVLLRYSFAIPKLIYCLRTAPCFLSPQLQLYDGLLCDIVSRISNCQFSVNDPAWIQCSLPVRLGGLGIRSALHLAPVAYLASSAASVDLVHLILPSFLSDQPIHFTDDALSAWSTGHSHPPPEGLDRRKQRIWDYSKASEVADSLLNHCSDPCSKARLLASRSLESGAWLNVFPITSLGLRLDDSTIRTSIGLRLGLPLCIPHSCKRCGAMVDSLSTHGLHCKSSEGRFFRHSSMNDIILRALKSANLPARLEPTSLGNCDNKRPDGVTLVPWSAGRYLVWDFTCVDTYAPSYIPKTSLEVGAAATMAEDRKRSKYSYLGQGYSFSPVAIETSGVFGRSTALFLKDLGRRLRESTHDMFSYCFLIRRLSIELQRSNCISILGTLPT